MNSKFSKLTIFLFGLIIVGQVAFSQEFVPGEIIVKTKSNGGLKQLQKGFMGKLAQKGISLKSSFGKLQLHHFKLAPGVDLKSTLIDLQKDPDIEFAEPNFIIHKTEDLNQQINSLSFEEMKSSLSTLSNGSYSQSSAPVGVNDAWAEMTKVTSTYPLVAVLDTGIDYNHNVFVQSGALWVNSKEIPDNGIDDDGNGYIDDVSGWNFLTNHNKPWDDDGHGTHVSGIVVGLTTDIFDNPVLESKVKILPLKFLGADGSGDTADAVRAIDYAIASGAKVINASWGGSSYSRALHEAFSRAYEKGILIVTAAGNSGANNDSSPIYPANLNIPGLISVAASTNWDGLASFSDYGVQTVHIAAPGVTISSTYPNNRYGYSSGTSMAAPFISGVAALLLRESPQLSGYQIKETILNSAKSSVAFSQKIYTSGRVNVLDAMRAVKNLVGTESFLPSYTFSVPDRAIASDGSSSSPGHSSSNGGCGTLGVIKTLGGSNGDGPGANSIPVIVLFMLPLVLWALLRTGQNHHHVEFTEFELRFAKRVDVSDSVIVKTHQGNFTASLKNISKGGMAFSFNGKSVGINEQVSFVFTSRDNNEQIEVAGKIIWTDNQTMAGVQFQILSKYVQGFLLRTYA